MLGAQHLASARPARIEYFPTVLGCHPGTEAMTRLADTVGGLEGTFHLYSSLVGGKTRGTESRPTIYSEGRRVEAPRDAVNGQDASLTRVRNDATRRLPALWSRGTGHERLAGEWLW